MHTIRPPITAITLLMATAALAAIAVLAPASGPAEAASFSIQSKTAGADNSEGLKKLTAARKRKRRSRRRGRSASRSSATTAVGIGARGTGSWLALKAGGKILSHMQLFVKMWSVYSHTSMNRKVWSK